MQELPKLGLFGDSYIAFSPNPNYMTWSQMLGKFYQSRPWGKSGSNLFYAIDCWHREMQNGPVDFAIFTLTWHTRLYSNLLDRNNYFCEPDPNMWNQPTGFRDPEITDIEKFQRFTNAVNDYHRFIYDDHQARFLHDLQIQYILNLPRRYPRTQFVFIPNTEVSRDMAKKHHDQGVLLDFAFEIVSNQEPGSPGQMPLRIDHRISHLNATNHSKMAHLVLDLLKNYADVSNRVVTVDMDKFDLA